MTSYFGTMPHWAAPLLAAALLSPPAMGHDIVLVPAGGGALTVRYGHPHDWLPVDGEKLLELQVLGVGGTPADRHRQLMRNGLDLVLPKRSVAAPALVAARYDNGFWVEGTPGPDGKAEWRNTSRFMAPGAASVMLSVKFAKALAASATDEAVYRQRVGHLLEIVPQRNPLAAGAGETLAVLVLFDGKPLSGAGIENSNLIDPIPEDKITRYRTDADGIAQVPIRAKGVNTLAVDVERKLDAGFPGAERAAPADKVLMVATYTFVR